MKVYAEKEMSAYAKAGGVAEEALSNIRVVTAFSGQEKECGRLVGGGGMGGGEGEGRGRKRIKENMEKY